MDFQKRVDMGREWEIKVSCWLQENSQYVFDVYEYVPTENGAMKSARLKAMPPAESLVLPDLQVAAQGATHWIEVKYKSSAATGHAGRATGIDYHYWQQYRSVQEVTGLPVSIFFVHGAEREIRGASLDILSALAGFHERPGINHGQGGMVFWLYDTLPLVARIDDGGQIVPP